MRAAAGQIDMTRGPLLGNIIRFALPMAAANILQLLFTAADQMVVGRYAGATALAAVGSNTALINFLVNMFVGLSVGVNVQSSRACGGKDGKALSEILHTSLVLSQIVGVAVMAIGILFSGRLLVWMKTPGKVLPLASLYLTIYFLGMPAVMLYQFGAAAMRAAGSSRRPLMIITVCGLLNVILNLVFVIGLSMGVSGVAAATVISEYISALAVLIFLAGGEAGVPLRLKELRISPEALGGILRSGLPAGIQSSLFNLANITLQTALNTFGAQAMAGAAAAISVSGFIFGFMNGFSASCVTAAGQNFGAGLYKRVNRSVAVCALLAAGAAVILSAAVFGARRTLIGFYVTDAEAYLAAEVVLAYVCLPCFLCSIMDTLSHALRSIGYSLLPMAVSFAGSVLLRILWIAFVFPLHPTLDRIYITFPITWIVTAGVHFICYVTLAPAAFAADGRQKAGAERKDLQEKERSRDESTW